MYTTMYRRLGGPQGRSGQVRKIPSPPWIDPRNVQPVASCYTDWDIPTHATLHILEKSTGRVALPCSSRQHGHHHIWRDGHYSPAAGGQTAAWSAAGWSVSGRWWRSPGSVRSVTAALRRLSSGTGASGSGSCTAMTCGLKRELYIKIYIPFEIWN